MKQQHMFSNQMIAAILVPVILEQLLNSVMGTADTMMVSNVGSAAISAVSLVDSINVLVIQAFSALAAGGAIICAQYIGQKNKERAYMRPTDRPAEKQRKSKRICKTGFVYHHSNFNCSQFNLSYFPEAVIKSDLWFS